MKCSSLKAHGKHYNVVQCYLHHAEVCSFFVLCRYIIFEIEYFIAAVIGIKEHRIVNMFLYIECNCGLKHLFICSTKHIVIIIIIIQTVLIA